MKFDWKSLLVVGVVSLAAAVAIVVLVALALVGLSARSGPARPGGGASTLSPAAGTTLACVCLGAAAAILGYGLYLVV
jgi:hypothetical protein